MELWRAVPEGAREVVPGERCPKCQSPRVHRSRTRGGAEALLRSVSPMRPFKCSACKWRGWRIPVASQGPSLPVPEPEVTPKKKGKRQSSRSNKSPSGPERARRLLIIQILTSLALAAMTGGMVAMCHQ